MEKIILGVFANGNEYEKQHFIDAQFLLRRKGMYNKFRNFGPNLKGKFNSTLNEIERFKLDKFEFVVIGWNTFGNLNQNEVWFQTI